MSALNINVYCVAIIIMVIMFIIIIISLNSLPNNRIENWFDWKVEISFYFQDAKYPHE